MINRRIDILRKLLTLSQTHLGFVLEEKWEDWELTALQKEDFYKKLRAFKGQSSHPEEKELIDAIKEVEKQALVELTRKKNETKKELVEIDRITGGIENYHHSHQKSLKRHFNIKV